MAQFATPFAAPALTPKSASASAPAPAPALAPLPPLAAALPPVAVRPPVPALEDLHPALWRAHQMGGALSGAPGDTFGGAPGGAPGGALGGALAASLGGSPRQAGGAVAASGYAELDAQLPGGGWPAGVLTELLLPHAGVGELRLLAPVLGALQGQQRGVMWFDPPAAPCAWALSALGIDVRQLVVVRSRQALSGRVKGAARSKLPAADILWALEHALKSGHLGAALAWLPARLPADALRRLQLAAQAHDGPVFLLRDVQERSRASPAPLRLLLASAGPDLLRVQLLKRRGPPLATALTLALAPVLSEPALARALRLAVPAVSQSAVALRLPDSQPF